MNALVPQFALDLWSGVPLLWQDVIIDTVKILVVMISVVLIVAFSTYFERKVIGSMQARVGPNRVGPLGLLQPFADVFKLLFKEVIVPAESNRFLFVIAPLLSLIPALATWAVIPMNDSFVIADINAGLLYVLAETPTHRDPPASGRCPAAWSARTRGFRPPCRRRRFTPQRSMERPPRTVTRGIHPPGNRSHPRRKDDGSPVRVGRAFRQGRD